MFILPFKKFYLIFLHACSYESTLLSSPAVSPLPFPSFFFLTLCTHSCFLLRPTESTQCRLYVHKYRTTYLGHEQFLRLPIQERKLIALPNPGNHILLNISFVSLICAGICAALILCRTCVCSHSLCEFMCTTALSYPESTVLLQEFISSDSCNISAFPSQMISKPWGQGV